LRIQYERDPAADGQTCVGSGRGLSVCVVSSKTARSTAFSSRLATGKEGKYILVLDGLSLRYAVQSIRARKMSRRWTWIAR